MKTGYFNLLRSNNIQGAISIARWKPKYVPIQKEMVSLAPYSKLLQDFRADKITAWEYQQKYLEQLNKLDPNQVIEEMHKIAGEGNEPVLMCHCGKNDFCHRQIFAKWLEEKAGVIIEEFNVGAVERENGRIIGEKHYHVNSTGGLDIIKQDGETSEEVHERMIEETWRK